MVIIKPNAPAPAAAGDLIKNGSLQGFADDVIKASMSVPVIVDFWAPWCGPCKQLTPMLERLVTQAAGAVRLVKINIDENQELAAQLRIQSVPTVYAFVGGRPVDAFAGAVPESELRQFVQRLTKGAASPLDEALEAAQTALTNGDATLAAELFQRILSQDPRHPKALAGTIRARVLRGDVKAARSLISGLTPDLLANADVAAAVSAVELAEATKDTGDVDALRQRLAAAPGDHQARYELACALYGRGRTEAAIDELLKIIKAEREWNDEAARKQLIKIFEALGPTHALTIASRRRLSSILFS